MFIDKGIRASSMRPRTPLFEPGDIGSGNTEKGIMDTRKRHGNNMRHVDEGLLPKTVTIRCVLVPILMAEQSTQVQVTIDGDPLDKSRLYDANSANEASKRMASIGQYQGIHLKQIGPISVEYSEDKKEYHPSKQELPFDLGLQESGYIFTRLFKTQNQGLLTQRRRKLSHGGWLISGLKEDAGYLNSKPLLAYGGCFGQQISLEYIQQTFAHVALLDLKHPRFNIQRFNEWKALGATYPNISPIINNHYRFVDQLEEVDTKSLADQIMLGEVKLNIVFPNIEKPLSFRSVDYREYNGEERMVDITFHNDLRGKNAY